jgi:subtilisin family serine protease
MRNMKDMFIAYNGFSAEVQVQDLDKLFNTFGPNRVHVATLYKITDEYSNALIGADTAWTDPGVDGTGMYVGILDTGVDYKHPDLGGGFGPGYKVVAGYSFAEGISDPMDCNGHGTYVAGIIAANGAVKGVAPEAKIVFAKIVEDCEDSALDTTIAEAFDYMADPENLDEGPEGTHPPVVSVNMSFGSDSGFVDPYAPDQQAIENCISNGIIVSLAAGNAYWSYQPYGGYYPFFPDYATVGSPSVTPSAISVAASFTDDYTMWAMDDNESNTFGYELPGCSVFYPGAIDPPDPKEIFNPDNVLDVCLVGNQDPDNLPDPSVLNGKVALIQRPGGATRPVWANHAQNHGAIAVVFYAVNDYYLGPGYLYGMDTRIASVTIPVVFTILSAKNSFVSSGHVCFLSTFISVSNSQTLYGAPADTMVDFSSWGPPPDLSFKPKITAPGSGIWSTVPVAMGSYANYSGTSMAAPHIAACAALIMEEHSDWTPKQVKIALMNTAELITDPVSGLPYSPHLMGAGRVNIFNALHNDVTLTSASSDDPFIALGDIQTTKRRPLNLI